MTDIINGLVITDHQTNECNRAITIFVHGQGQRDGMSHRYVASWQGRGGRPYDLVLEFQHGPIADVGTNGITNEVLLAVLLDRLRGAQAGPYKCRENALALTKLEEALHWLEARTKARMARGVEGTHTP